MRVTQSENAFFHKYYQKVSNDLIAWCMYMCIVHTPWESIYIHQENFRKENVFYFILSSANYSNHFMHQTETLSGTIKTKT